MAVPLPRARPNVVGNPSGDSGIFDSIGSGIGDIFNQILAAGGSVIENVAALKSAELQRDLATFLGVEFDDPAQAPALANASVASGGGGFTMSLPLVLAGVGGLVLLLALLRNR